MLLMRKMKNPQKYPLVNSANKFKTVSKCFNLPLILLNYAYTVRFIAKAHIVIENKLISIPIHKLLKVCII